MESRTSPAGLKLICDVHGSIIQVAQDDLGLAGPRVREQLFPLVVDQGSLQKALSFMAEVRATGTAIGWELNVPLEEGIATLYFVGLIVDDELVIMAGKNQEDAHQLLEEMMRINNQQTTALRSAIKVQTDLARDQTERDDALYDEISRLNNELITLQRELAKKTAELEKLNELKNRFLGMAAHDLRSPLGVIIGYSEFLLDETSDALSEEHTRFLSLIHSSSQFMLQLIEDFLDVSIIESGKLRLNLQPVDLIDLVQRSVDLNRPRARKKDIQLSFHPTPPLPPVILDAAKIEQVLNNIISNAVKFSHPDTTIRIHLSQDEERSERQDETQRRVVIAVQDQGQGIPADEMDKLFEMFERTTVRGTGGEKSSGLGLAIARKIVEGHRGRIWAESQVGQGTTFFVSLPIHLDSHLLGSR